MLRITRRVLQAGTSSGPSVLHQVLPRTRPLYLDMQATSPMDPRVIDAMMPFQGGDIFGNPHSRTHAYGWTAEEHVEKSRAAVASLIKADPADIVFTSGATESNNIAIKGVANFNKRNKRHIITTQIEHKCVLESCRALEEEGFEVTYLPVKKDGLVDLEQLEAAMRPKQTVLVSVMYVNNEVGVVQPIAEIGRIARKHGAYFHTDAAQALGKIPIDVNAMNIDLLSMSAHKIYGPKGVGGLYVRRRPRVRLQSPISGGGQERGFRSGTLPSALIVGFGEACSVADREMERDLRHVRRLHHRMWTKMAERIPNITVNGSLEHRYPGNLNVSFECVEGESLLLGISSVAVSSGSACTSATLEPSYVLRALGVSTENAHTSLRFGLGRFTTDAEVDYTVDLLAKEVERLRSMSPLWDMVQQGIDLSTIKWTAH